MNWLEKLNFTFTTYGRLIIAMFNFRLWPPFAIYLLVMALLVMMISSMFSPLLSGWLIPILVATSNNAILHYPQHVALLPEVFQKVNFLLGPSLLLESLLTGVGMLMFAAYFQRQKTQFGASLRTALRYYWKIVLIWLVNSVLVYLLFQYLPELFRGFVLGSPRRELALQIGMQGLSALLAALFAYTIPYLLIRNRPLMSCFTGSFNLFFRNFFTTFFFVALPQFLYLGYYLTWQDTSSLVFKFNPVFVVILTLGLTVLSALVNFFTSGSIVRFFLEVSED